MLPLHRIHRRIGIGVDQLGEARAGERFDAERGDAVGDLLDALDRTPRHR